jgi:hypothetical protein
MVYQGFCGPSYVSQSKIASDDRCVNWLPEKIENPYGKASYALYPVAGYETFCVLPESPWRGGFTLNGDSYAVGGESLYRLPIALGGTPTLLATGLHNPDDSPVFFASNGDAGLQLFMTSGSVGYVYDFTTGTLTVALETATQCAFLDGFFLALNPNLSELNVSGLENGAASEWAAIGVARRNDAADKWIAMVRCLKEIWLFGAQTTSVYYEAGLSPFPFAPNPSVFIQYGITAPLSAAVLDNAPMWLGQSLDGGAMVYRSEGYTPRRVSNHALEYAMSQYGASALLTARAFVYQINGHSLYVLTFPGIATWVYDASTGFWHEEGEWNGNDYVGLPVFGHIFANGVHLTGDTTSGNVYRMSMDLSTMPDGAAMRRLRRAPHLAQELTRVIHDSFQLDFEAGLALVTGQGSDPQYMLRWSDDGGQTWGNEVWMPGGRIGAYTTRAIWRRLGMARDRVYELAFSDPVASRLIGAYVKVRGGPS